jgi:hypothetical protein
MRLSAFRREPTRRNAASCRGHACVARPSVVGTFLVVIATLELACNIEPPEPPAFVVDNGTDVPVEIRYLTERQGLLPDDLERLRSVALLEPGETARFGPLGNNSDTCLDAPLVAIGPDGAEVDRLEAGTCADSDVRPTWEIGARSHFDDEGALRAE